MTPKYCKIIQDGSKMMAVVNEAEQPVPIGDDDDLHWQSRCATIDVAAGCAKDIRRIAYDTWSESIMEECFPTALHNGIEIDPALVDVKVKDQVYFKGHFRNLENVPMLHLRTPEPVQDNTLANEKLFRENPIQFLLVNALRVLTNDQLRHLADNIYSRLPDPVSDLRYTEIAQLKETNTKLLAVLELIGNTMDPFKLMHMSKCAKEMVQQEIEAGRFVSHATEHKHQ